MVEVKQYASSPASAEDKKCFVASVSAMMIHLMFPPVGRCTLFRSLSVCRTAPIWCCRWGTVPFFSRPVMLEAGELGPALGRKWGTVPFFRVFV
jgi:hypothetical protein